MVSTPSRRSVPGVLPVVAESLMRSMTSSASWKATPIRSPNSSTICSVRVPAPVSIAP